MWHDGQPALLRYLHVLAPDAAEDIAAETWTHVVRGLARFRGTEQNWRAWLFTTARRRVIDQTRQLMRRPAISLEALPDLTLADLPGLRSPGMPGRPRSRRPRLIAAPLGARFAAAAGAAVIAVLGGGAAAAYTGSLPGALQKIAHEAIAAPGVHEGSAAPTLQGSGHPAGPSVTGAAAYGLCNAYQHAEEHGNASQRSVAFRKLVSAAGGADQVAAYCASVPHPGATSLPGRRVGQTASPTDASHGRKPTAPPGKPTAPPGKPITPPGKPTTSPGNGGGNGNGNGPGR